MTISTTQQAAENAIMSASTEKDMNPHAVTESELALRAWLAKESVSGVLGKSAVVSGVLAPEPPPQPRPQNLRPRRRIHR